MIPEVDRIRGIEIRPGHRIGVEEPLADDPRLPGRDGPDLVGHQVVGVQAQQQVGPHQEVVDAPLVRRGDPGEWRPTMPQPVDGHRVEIIPKLHPATAPRPIRLDVLALVVRRQPVELRMDTRTVIALGIVLADDLPVGVDLVIDAARAPQVSEREPVDVLPQVGHRCLQVGRVGIQRQEHEPLPQRRPWPAPTRTHPDRNR